MPEGLTVRPERGGRAEKRVLSAIEEAVVFERIVLHLRAWASPPVEQHANHIVLHLREGVGEIYSSVMLAMGRTLIGGPLGEQGEDRRQVVGYDLGVNVLAQAQPRGSREVPDLQT